VALLGCETPTGYGSLAAALTGAYGVAHPNVTGVSTNYVVLEVTKGDYTKGNYALDEKKVTPTPVLTDGGRTILIKLEVPAGLATAELVVTENGESVLKKSVTFDAAGAAAPGILYGEKPMAFSEFFHDVTANIAAVRPSSTAFAAAGTVPVPKLFITAGTRTGNGSTHTTANPQPDVNPKWTDTDAQAKVDVISSATYGDDPHFVPTGNLDINYDNPMTKKEGNEVTGIKAVEVGVDFDLFANADILRQADKAVDTSTAVLAQVTGTNISRWKAATAVYKAKYLQPDGTWGKRDETAVTETVAASWPKPVGGANGATVSVSYGGAWADKTIAVDFAPLTAPLESQALWNDYFDYAYAGYVEDLQTGHKEPLVWLQNLFSHRGHTNLEAAIDRHTAGISRMNSLSPDGNMRVVILARGFKDIIVESVGVVADGDSLPSIEQGSVFHVSGTGSSANFQNSEGAAVPGRQLHVGNLSTTALADFASKGGVIQKGGTDAAGYTLALEGEGEIAITLQDAFFSGSFQGAYTLRINADPGVNHPTTSFTVNCIITRPTLKQGSSGTASSADSATGAIEVTTSGGNIEFSNADFAKAIMVSGRSISSITPAVTGGITAVLKQASTGAYEIDASALTADTTYTLTILTSNFVNASRATISPTVYYIKVQ
jgi:hypothetical protein